MKNTIKYILIALAVIIVVSCALGATVQLDDATPSQTESGQVQEQTKGDENVEPEQEEPKDDETRTSGGIGYGEAVQACDRAAQETLFPGDRYDSDPIIGRQKGMVVLNDDQYLAVYNVKVDGRKTGVSCLVDGTKDAPHVISINETSWK